MSAASERTSFHATAGDVAGTAAILLRAGLASEGEYIKLDTRLARHAMAADRMNLVAIAKLFLLSFPPSWIVTVVANDLVDLDLVPSADLEALDWLGSDLAPIIVEVHRSLTHQSDEALRRQIGLAGELVVMSALRNSGFDPVHVSLVSDSYGYDIEYRDGAETKRIEVKAAFRHTSDRILISRNEFDRALAYGSSWRLVQVVLSTQFVVGKLVDSSTVLTMREIGAEQIRALAPPVSATFRWVESAEFRPPAEIWTNSGLTAEPDLLVSLAQ